ncbi:MAG: hypothetical protein ACTSR8_22695, partial [Promethearchaeota archaeon]
PKVHKYLNKLNGYFVGYDFIHFISGPNMEQINMRINELYRNDDGTFDEAGFLKFLWKNAEGGFKKTYTTPEGNEELYTTKMWLADLYRSILNYEGTDPSIQQAKLSLEYFTAKPEYADMFNLLESDKFTEQEAKLGEKLLESIQDIFGHFTVRLTFANMLDFYYKDNGIGIKIVRRPRWGEVGRREPESLPDYLDHVGLKTPTAKAASMHLYSILEEQRVSHLFGYFFIDSSLDFKLDTGNSYFASLRFGPLINLESGIIKTYSPKDQRLLPSSRKFSQILADKFSSIYEQKYVKRNVVDIADEYIKTHSVLFEQLKKNIIDKIDILYEDGHFATQAEKRFFIDKIIKLLRRGIFSINLDFDEGRAIRAQVNDFLSGILSYRSQPHLGQTDIIFYGIPDPSGAGDFRVMITIEQLLELDFVCFGDLGSISTKDPNFYTRIKRLYLMRQSEDMAENLKQLILSDDIQAVTGGKVRIYPVMDIDKDVGYQFLFTTHSRQVYEYLPYGEGKHLTGGYFEVDFSDPNSDDFFILQHIALIMQTGQFSFIMTKNDDNIVSFQRGTSTMTRQIIINEIICAFNREGFLSHNDILSKLVPGPSRDYIDRASVFQVIFPTDFDYSIHGLDNEWFDENYPMWFSFGGGPADLAWYMKDLRSGRNSYSKKIRNSLNI